MKKECYLYVRNLKKTEMKTPNIPATTPKTVNAVIAWVRSHDFSESLYFDFYHIDMTVTRFSFGSFAVNVDTDSLEAEFGKIYYAAAQCLNAQN